MILKNSTVTFHFLFVLDWFSDRSWGMSYFTNLSHRNGPIGRKWFDVAKIDEVNPVDVSLDQRITISLEDDIQKERDEKMEQEQNEEEIVPIGRVCEEVDMACRSYDPLGVTGVPRIQKSALTVPVPFAVLIYLFFCQKNLSEI